MQVNRHARAVSTVRFAPVGYSRYGDPAGCIINDIQYAVIAYSQPPFIFKSDQFPAARGAWISPETVDYSLDALADLDRQTLKLTHRRRSKENGVSHQRDGEVCLPR